MKKEFGLGAIVSIRFDDSSFSSLDEALELYEYLIGEAYNSIHQITVHRRCVSNLKKQLAFFDDLGRDMSRFRANNKYDHSYPKQYKRRFVEKMVEKYGEKHLIESIKDPLGGKRKERVRHGEKI